MNDDEITAFLVGCVCGAIIIIALWGVSEHHYELTCEQKHNVFDCNKKAESYEPSDKGVN